MNLTSIYTLIALIAFAGNSIFCRLALGEDKIDAAGFTIVRLLSGIVILMIIFLVRNRGLKSASKGSWRASFMLFMYAASFSFAYIYLDTGTGALILFGMVQITMILAGLAGGARLKPVEWIGSILAFSGFVYLVRPMLTTPSWLGSILMTAAGISWAGYTLAGKTSEHPADETAFNFLRTLPFVLLLLAAGLKHISLSPEGVFLAIGSGTFASGIGYVLWYAALKGLSNTQAAVVQLLVPVFAAAGGIMFAGETLSFHLVFSAAVIISGILIVILAK